MFLGVYTLRHGRGLATEDDDKPFRVLWGPAAYRT